MAVQESSHLLCESHFKHCLPSVVGSVKYPILLCLHFEFFSRGTTLLFTLEGRGELCTKCTYLLRFDLADLGLEVKSGVVKFFLPFCFPWIEFCQIVA